MLNTAACLTVIENEKRSFLAPGNGSHSFSQESHRPLQEIASSRRNSRILPNPIQPPTAMALHARKMSYEREISDNTEQPGPTTSTVRSNGASPTVSGDVKPMPTCPSTTALSELETLQHGGFVSGFELWSNNNACTSASALERDSRSSIPKALWQQQSSVPLQRGASADGADALPINTVYSSDIRSENTRCVRSSSFTSESSANSMDSPNCSDSSALSSLENSISADGLEESASTCTKPHSGPSFSEGFGLYGAMMQNPSEAAGPALASSSHGSYEMCGLCGAQLATVVLGNCGHRVCNVCHRHEKHRSMQLAHSSTPICPFCAHGVAPSASAAAVAPTMNPFAVDPIKQQRHVWSQRRSEERTYSHHSFPPRRPLKHSAVVTNDGKGARGCDPENFDGWLPYSSQYHPSHSLLHSSASTPYSFSSTMPGKSTGPPPPFAHAAPSFQRPNLATQHHSLTGLNHYAPNFQPSGLSIHQHQRDSQGSAALTGRAGTATIPMDAWRESGMGMAMSDVDRSNLSKDLSHRQSHQYQHHHLMQHHLQYQHQQQRRGNMASTPQAFIPRASHQAYQYYGAAESNCGGMNGAASSAMLSFPILPNLPPAIPPTTPKTSAIQWAVVRVTNIPWDVSLQDMLAFFAGFPHPPEHLLSQNVHILMDRSSGKTFNSAFIELALTPHQAGMVAQARNLKVLKGRLVTVELSSQDELMRSLFPKWAGQFQNGEPLINGEQLVTSTATAAATGDQETEDAASSNESGQPSRDSEPATSTAACTIVAPYTPPFITRDEINSLLLVCRNYKLHFSRKCAERPFENILSILAKYPWHQPYRVLPLHRDHIFELLKLSIESLRLHLNKEYNNIQSTLLHRMVRSAILTPAFTERQKNMVLHVAGYSSAPEDLAGWMSPVAAVDADTEDASSAVVQGLAPTKGENVVGPFHNKRVEDVETVVEDLGMIDASKSIKPAEVPSSCSLGQASASEGAKSNLPVSWAAVAAPCNIPASKLQGAHESGGEGAQRKTNDAWLSGPAKISLKNVPASKKPDDAASGSSVDTRPMYRDSPVMTMSTDLKRKFSLSNKTRHDAFQEGNTEHCTELSKSL
ncbi:unnamed protein product [Mortierella alpina]